jgi:hypothetical protein
MGEYDFPLVVVVTHTPFAVQFQLTLLLSGFLIGFLDCSYVDFGIWVIALGLLAIWLQLVVWWTIAGLFLTILVPELFHCSSSFMG